MINIILCNSSLIKERNIRMFFENKFIKKEIIINKIILNNSYIIQPINSEGITKCYNKIMNMITHVNKNQIPNIDFIVTINNSLEILNNNINDIVNIMIYEYSLNKIYEYSGIPIKIDILILDKYPDFTKIINTLVKNYEKNYLSNGIITTIDTIIYNYYPELFDWRGQIFKKSYNDQINEGLDFVFNYSFNKYI